VAPRKQRTRPGMPGEARDRRRVAEKFLEVADLTATEDGVAIDVTVGLAVLAGIAAGDAVCLSAAGERYAGPDHGAAADLLARVDPALGRRLGDLVGLKPAAHYGSRVLTVDDRTRAVRHAGVLVQAARSRTT
jgi:hypothetical protein